MTAADTEAITGSDQQRKPADKPADKFTSEDIGRGAGRLVGGGVNSLKRWKNSFTDGSAEADD